MLTQQDRFQEAVLQGVKEALETESKNRKLEVKSISIPRQISPADLSKIKAARTSQGSFVNKVFAEMRVVDKNSGKVLNEGRAHVADVPIRTPLGTYLIDGVHYQNANQSQLKGTGFTQIKNNGQVETDFRLEKGWNFKLQMDPEDEQFKVQYKSSRYPLAVVLDAMKVPQSSIEKSLGKGIAAKNRIDEDKLKKETRRLARKLFNAEARGKTHEEMQAMLKEHFEKKSELNPEASRLTLGKAFKTVTPEAILAASSKILSIHADEAEPDAKDEIYFKRFRDIAETGSKWIDDSKKSIQMKVKRRIEKDGLEDMPMRSIIGMDIVNPVIKSMFTKAKLRGAGESTNLLDLLANESKITVMGEDGISNRHRISNVARDVRPSGLGFIDPVMTPQGSAGETEHIAIGATIENNKIKTKMRNARTGLLKSLAPEDLFGKVVAFPGEVDEKGGKLFATHWSGKAKAVKDGKIITVKPEEIDFIVPAPELMYSEITNLVPFLSANSGGRAIMATGQMTQAVPLEDPDAPLVRANNTEASPSFSLGSRAPVAGTVRSVSETAIKIEDKDRHIHEVQLYDNLPLNRESFIDSKPLVKKGDKVKKGQVLADNPFTENGVLALGKNMLVAVMPKHGYNYEDGQVVSESAAKKMTSVHMYDFSTRLGDKQKLDPARWKAYGGEKYKQSAEGFNNLDPMTGLVKPGSVVKKGDVLAQVVVKHDSAPESAILKMFRKSLVKQYDVQPLVWEREAPGVVVESKANGNKINMFVKAMEPAQVGDKLADRHGHKGVITKILPDNEMPKIKETGEVIDVMIDPTSIPSRVNIGQILEMSASKIAKKTGKPYMASIHARGNYADKLKRELEENGIKDKSVVTDPVSGRDIPNINVAPKYLMKLRHQVEHKLQTRNAGGSYDIDEQPIKGRSLDNLTFYAMVAHGAKKNLAEMSGLKSQRNPQFWADFEAGAPITMPAQPTYSWDKFDAYMKVMGLNPKKDSASGNIKLMPMTDKETMDLSGGNAITSPDVVRKKNFQPVPGGIFDEYIHGGVGKDAKQWSHINLPEPVLNPLFDRAAASLTGLTQKKLRDINRGQIEIEGATGGLAVKKLLDDVDITAETTNTLREAEQLAAAGGVKNFAKLNEVNRKLRYLSGLKEFRMTPSEAYMMNTVPVMPPTFRQPITLPDGNISVPAVNYLYKDIALTALDAFPKVITEKSKNEVRKDLYDTVAALVGTQDSVGADDTPGVLMQLAGKSTGQQKKQGINKQSKHGLFKRKVMRKRQDLSAGSVISVEPKLGVDEVGMPEEAAWNMFEPMVKRRLAQRGYGVTQAKEEFDARSLQARSALDEEMAKRPVMVNRAPSWHKFNIMGAWPKIHEGNDLKVPNLPINTYFGGDFDGDTMSIHVPVTQGAIDEAKEMMPSKLFMKSGSGTVMLQPQGSALAGLYDMTSDNPTSKSFPADILNKYRRQAEDYKMKDMLRDSKIAAGVPKFMVGQQQFASDKALRDAFDAGLVLPHETVVREDGTKTTVGRQIVDNILPDRWSINNKQVNNSDIRGILTEIAKDRPAMLAQVANELNKVGDQNATYMGLSLGIDDVALGHVPGQETVRNLIKDVDYLDSKWKFKQGREATAEREAKKAKLFSTAIDKMDGELVATLPDENNFKTLWKSGAKGKETQLRQILGPPTLFKASSHDLYHAVETPFSAGLDPSSYYIQQTGGRFGLVQRGVETAIPGDIGKDLLGISGDHSVTEQDCGTLDGIIKTLNDRDIIGRYLAKSNSVADRNDPIDANLVTSMKRAKIRTIKVRSPLTCKARNGVCSMCYGQTAYGQQPKIGTAVGVEDAQGVIDVIANLALKAFHISGGKETGEMPFNKFRRVIDMPSIVPNKAILAKDSGYIEKIEKNDLGGVDVYVRGERHRLPANLGVDPMIKEGYKVKKGDQLTLYGNKKPQEVLDLKGIKAAQEHIVDEFASIFDSDKPGNITRRSLENVTAAMTGLARVIDPGDSDYTHFDIGRSNDMAYFNDHRVQELPRTKAVGYLMAETVGHIPKGTEIDSTISKELRKLGVKKVKIEKKPIQFEPVLKNVRSIPKYKSDWMSRLNQKYLSDTIKDEGAFGSTADIHGFHPVPGFAYGAEFGKNNDPARY